MYRLLEACSGERLCEKKLRIFFFILACSQSVAFSNVIKTSFQLAI